MTLNLYWFQSRTKTKGIFHLQTQIYNQPLTIHPVIILGFIHCFNATMVKNLPFPLITAFIKSIKMCILIQASMIK